MDELKLSLKSIETKEIEKQLMLGNEAVARGAYEAGVHVVASYPGTPSTEITANIAKYGEINSQWGPNEKVAVEVAFGASLVGARAMSCMKHVGVNVAADPLFTAAYTGVNGGLVLVVADDPGMHSSQNEQDSRYYAKSAHVPMLEPADSAECSSFTKLAFAMSEELDTPVFLRLTTRTSHARSIVPICEKKEIPLKPYVKDVQKYVMMPGMARKRHLVVEAREKFLKDAANRMDINIETIRDTEIGIITSGVCYEYVRDALPNASTLKLGLVYPLAMEKIKEFASKVKRLIVIEELEGIIEDEIRAEGIKVEGKNLTGIQGELSVEKIKYVVLGEGEITKPDLSLPGRPPILCPGCPHHGVFYSIKKLGLRVMGDIGCYTLGALPPLNGMDACLCMGASIGMASGAERARGKEFSENTVAVLGDSTFIHSGITGLIDAVYNKLNITVCILDNRITGMTGHQQNPSTGFDIHNNEAPQLNFENLVTACGVNDLQVVDPLNLKAMEAAFVHATKTQGVSVIITRRPCVLIKKPK